MIPRPFSAFQGEFGDNARSIRALAHYSFALAVMTVYGGEVCPLMDTLPVWKLGLVILIALAAAFAVRPALVRRLVAPLEPSQRSRRQFKLDFSLMAGAGLLMALCNLAAFDFPFVQSGLKLSLGLAALGVFAGIDLALKRERAVIAEAARLGLGRKPPERLYPLTRKFFHLGAFIAAMLSAILAAVILRDLDWLSRTSPSQGAIADLERSVVIEIFFVMAVMLGQTINLIHSYSKNLKFLFSNQTEALEKVGRGDLSGFVPVATNDELGFIAGHTNMMIEELKDRSRLKESIETAREIQATLLPIRPPEVQGLDLAGISIPSDETGGDYFDFFQSGTSGTLTVIVGDVTGHGVGAALLMASARALIRLRTSLPGSLSGCMADVNRLMARDTYGSGRFMTLFCLLAAKDRTLVWAGAGHDPAIAYDPKRDAFEELKGSGLPLGVIENAEYKEFAREPLRDGEIIALGTDGVWEARNPAGEMFGKDRLREAIRANAARTAQEILEAVTSGVKAFQAGRAQDDDITLVVIKGV